MGCNTSSTRNADVNRSESSPPDIAAVTVTSVTTTNVLASTAPTNTSAGSDLLLKGVSVHYLKTVLLQEMQDAGLDPNTTKVYELEPDLKSKKLGLIRRKGKDIICPRDGKLGAAYVDSIKEEGCVGRANVMLSYTWGYKVKDIVSTLADKCRTDGRDPKNTYVWICCLCNNQHRIGEDDVPFEDFRETFFGTVTGVGTVWSMMSPWNDPEYLQRVWCVFEVYIANTNDEVKSEIIMPEDQKEEMIQSLADINNLFDAMSNTRIENAKASREEDKKNILELVRDEIGSDELNNKMNVLLREWISATLMAEVVEDDVKDTSNDVDKARKIYDIARAFTEMGSYDTSIKLCQRSIIIREKVFGEDHEDTAASYSNIGRVMKKKGDYDGALAMYQKSLTIYEKSFGEDHPSTATTYNNIGLVMRRKGDYDDALVMFQKCLTIREKSLGNDHTSTADSYNNIGLVMVEKGNYDSALEMYQKSLTIREKSLGKDHPTTAASYNNIGLAIEEKGDYDGALVMLEKALVIREKSLGKDHPSTAKSYNNIGAALEKKGDYDGALVMLEKVLDIRKKSLGKDHPDTVSVYESIDRVKSLLSKWSFSYIINNIFVNQN